ncbi:MAG: PaaI family thioesterase [Pseudomonadota bacterium]
MSESSGPTGTALDAFPAPPCAQLLGFKFLSLDRDAKTIRAGFEATEAMLNPRGMTQGGFLTAMLDDAMGFMIVALTNGEKAPASVDLHTQFLRPAPAGAYVGEARLKHMTNSTAFTEATLYDAQGEAVAAAVQTQRLFPIPKAGAGSTRS